jgi:hypothetical protein
MKPVHLLLHVLLLACAARASATDMPIVSVHEEPRHRLIFEKGHIRAFHTVVPADDMSLFHYHADPTLYVVLGPALLRNQNLGEDWQEPDPSRIAAVGALLFVDYADTPQTHRVHNIGQPTFEVFGVINAGAGGRPPTPMSTAPELENTWFTATRFRLAPGDRTPAAALGNPAFVIQPGKGSSAVLVGGSAVAVKTVAGNWSWHDAETGIELLNTGRNDIELIVIETR